MRIRYRVTGASLRASHVPNNTEVRLYVDLLRCVSRRFSSEILLSIHKKSAVCEPKVYEEKSGQIDTNNYMGTKFVGFGLV